MGFDLSGLLGGLLDITWQQLIMIAVALLLLYLGIFKDYEPTLLIPIGFGCILGNLPVAANMIGEEGLFGVLYRAGISNELFPLLIFLGVGAMLDLRPLLSQPVMFVMGALAHLGIFATLVIAILLGFNLAEATAIGMIGAIDGPTVIYVNSKLGSLFVTPGLAAAIAVTAYSYMSLVPIIQPPLMRLFTTKKERAIRMEYTPRPVSRMTVILFPILITAVAGIFLPEAAPLIATLMLGNLIKESEVVPGLVETSKNAITNTATIFLGITIGSTMQAATFLNTGTLRVLILGLIAFALNTIGGLLFGKLICLLSGRKINPLVGAAAISAFPMSGRLAQKVALEVDNQNFILMHALGANAAGQVASVLAAGILMQMIFPILLH
ncbi:MAG TPA: sodium ion-translocating decarboxylase subunit beta [Anaerolineaceae bacterium]|nr:sodium ion-translocating decarboxylase subunit beta [Anaerolineaceae bacterium]HOS54098.1 sodium ion-translocating decarboxylase subunit beta [Anaerolineaceae bacterium]HPD62196.1 sodium ion-translocating decarboxylase subunit beta [Anaerolineaceae bacterium]HQF68876.1 sodium ion-translocating decarboxylase subunit beta [Anaerolineaceae bacterium]HQK05076.1 sodium ion-translocating decarboxylase subunit beta [Anaerolineaceae bacterium]